MIKKARGIAIYTSMRSGIAPFGGSGGSGLVMARLPDGSWSGPSFITPQNASAGFMVGVDIYDVVLLIMSETALEGFKTHKLTLGAETAIAAGPVGTGASMDMSVNGVDWTGSKQPVPEGEKRKIAKPPAPVFSYSRNRGFYAGLEGMAMIYLTRFDENERVYHWPGLTGRDVLEGKVRKPVEARMLYDALIAAETGQAQATVSDLRIPKELDNASLAALSHQSSSSKTADADSESITDSTHDGSSSTKVGSDDSQTTTEGPLVLDDGEKLHLPPTPEQLDYMEQAGIRDEEDERLEAEHREYVWSLPEPPRHPAALRRSEGIIRTKAGHRFVAPDLPPGQSKETSIQPLQRSLSQESTGTLRPSEVDPPPAYSPGSPKASIAREDSKTYLEELSERNLAEARVGDASSSEAIAVKVDGDQATPTQKGDVIAGSTSVNAAVAMNLGKKDVDGAEDNSSNSAFEEAVEGLTGQPTEESVAASIADFVPKDAAVEESAPASKGAHTHEPVQSIPPMKKASPVEDAEDVEEQTSARDTKTVNEIVEPVTPKDPSANFHKGSVEEESAQSTPTFGDNEGTDQEGNSEEKDLSKEPQTLDTDPDTVKKSRRKTATELLLDTMWSGRSGTPASGLGLLPGEASTSTPVGRSFTPGRLFSNQSEEVGVSQELPEEEEAKAASASEPEHKQEIAVPGARRGSLHLGTDDDDLDGLEDTQRSREASESGPSTRHSADSWRPDYDTDSADEGASDAFAMLSKRFSSIPSASASASRRAAGEDEVHMESNEPLRNEQAQTRQEVPFSAAPTPAPINEVESDAESNDNFAEVESIHQHTSSDAVAEPIEENLQPEEEPKIEADESRITTSVEAPNSKTPEPTQPSVGVTRTFSRPKRDRPMSTIITPERPNTPGTPTTPSTPVAGGAPIRPQRSASRAVRPPRSSARPQSMVGSPSSATPVKGDEPQA